MHKYICIFTPSNTTLPSHQYSGQGYLDEHETHELRQQLIGSSSTVMEFDSEQQYLAHLEEVDYERSNELLEEHIDLAGGWL